MGQFRKTSNRKAVSMEEKAGYGKIDSWARQSPGISPDTDFSISEERAKELPAQMAKGDVDQPFLTLASAYGGRCGMCLRHT